MAPRATMPSKATGGMTSRAPSRSNSRVDDVRMCAPENLTLLRKVGMCAGLLFSESIGVFSALFILPVLQTLGTPVYMLTLPGVISASLGLAFVPLLGWVSDGGSQPHRRKKPAVVFCFVIAWLGLGLSLYGTVLHFTTQASTKAIITHQTTLSSTASLQTALLLSESTSAHPEASTATDLMFVYSTTALNQTSEADETSTASLAVTSNASSVHYTNGLDALAENSTQENSNSSLIPVTEIQDTVFVLPAILGMAGFVFMDLGFDSVNCAVKTLMLSHSGPADHVSLLILGVFVSALGGCITPITGMVDLSSLMPDWDPFVTQLFFQLVILMGIGVVCCVITLASTPALQAPPTVLTLTKETDVAEDPESGAFCGSGEMGDSYRSEWQESVVMAAVTLQSEAQENMIMAATSPMEALLGTSTQVERSMSMAGLSVSLGLAHFYTSNPAASFHPPSSSSDASDTTRLMPNSKASTAHHNYSTIPEDEESLPDDPPQSCRDNRKFKLFVIWALAFFTACPVFLFSVTVSDYLGKVVFGGDPEADVNSEAHAQYEKGVRGGSLSVLVLSSTYVIFSLFHSKVLAVLGPKIEYAIVSAMVLGLLIAVRMSGSIYVVYVTSALMGMYRAEMYTIPFMMANRLCQESDSQSVSGGEGGHPKVGSTMALVTCALPSAYLVTSSVVGPLIDATGDPSAPMLMGMACALLAALTVFAYKS